MSVEPGNRAREQATLWGQQHGASGDIAQGAAEASHVRGDDRQSSSASAALSQNLPLQECMGKV